MIKNMGLASIVVADLKKSKAFFTEVLGLKDSGHSSEEHGLAELKVADGDFTLGVAAQQENKGNTDEATVLPGQNAIVTFTVADIVLAKRELESKQVKMFGDIIEVPGHVKMQLFADQDRNKFQLFEMLDGDQE